MNSLPDEVASFFLLGRPD